MTDINNSSISSLGEFPVDIVATGNDENTLLERDKKDFLAWQTDGITRCILSDIFQTGDKSIGSKDYPIGDQSTWNVFNLTVARSIKFPDTPPTDSMKVKARNWLILFRSYALEWMKNKVMSDYLVLFNSEEYNDLRGTDHAVVGFKEMTKILKNYKDEEVILLFILF